MDPQTDVTRLLQEVERGESRAADALLPVVYRDLRRLAQSYLKSERAEHTLQATELVHEAYLRLIDQTRVDWQSRGHFMAIAAQAMRRILVEHARRRGRDKRGGGAVRISIDDARSTGASGPGVEVLALNEALDRLAAAAPEKARVVELRFFGGLSVKETAAVLDLGERSVERYFLYGRTWLYRELSGPSAQDEARPP
jgi:RNA polymerase sigma factor (TIGR02999 family)